MTTQALTPNTILGNISLSRSLGNRHHPALP